MPSNVEPKFRIPGADIRPGSAAARNGNLNNDVRAGLNTLINAQFSSMVLLLLLHTSSSKIPRRFPRVGVLQQVSAVVLRMTNGRLVVGYPVFVCRDGRRLLCMHALPYLSESDRIDTRHCSLWSRGVSYYCVDSSSSHTVAGPQIEIATAAALPSQRISLAGFSTQQGK